MPPTDDSRARSVPFPVEASRLAVPELSRWVEAAYGLPAGEECRLISESINQTYRLGRDGETWFLRVGRKGWRTRSEVEAEAAIIEALRGVGLRVAAARRRLDGSFAGEIPAPEGTRAAVLFTSAPGEGVREIEPRHCRAYGRLAAGMHDAFDAHPERFDRFRLGLEHLIDEPLAAIRRRMAEHAEEMAYLEEVAARVRERIAALPMDGADFGLCHGDLHPGNVRFDENGEPTLFDFDCCGYGWRAYDLAVFLWNSYTEGRPKRWRQSRWAAFLRGYREVRPVETATLELAPLFLVARQIWLGGLDCAGASGWLPQWIDAGWFRTLNRLIRRWVEEFEILR